MHALVVGGERRADVAEIGIVAYAVEIEFACAYPCLSAVLADGDMARIAVGEMVLTASGEHARFRVALRAVVNFGQWVRVVPEADNPTVGET